MWKYSHTHTHIYIYIYMSMIVHVIRSTRKCTHLTTMSRWNTWVAGLFNRELALLASFRMVTARSRCYMKDLPWPRAQSVLKRNWSRWPIELTPNCKSSTWCLLLLLSGGICNWDVDFSWHSFGAYHHCILAARSPANSLMIIGLLSTNCPSISLCTVMGCLGQAAAEVFAANRRGLRASGSLALTLLFVGYIG